MPKYSVGAKVAFAEDKLILAPEFAGRSGRVTEVYSEMQVQTCLETRGFPHTWCCSKGKMMPCLRRRTGCNMDSNSPQPTSCL